MRCNQRSTSAHSALDPHRIVHRRLLKASLRRRLNRWSYTVDRSALSYGVSQTQLKYLPDTSVISNPCDMNVLMS